MATVNHVDPATASERCGDVTRPATIAIRTTAPEALEAAKSSGRCLYGRSHAPAPATDIDVFSMGYLAHGLGARTEAPASDLWRSARATPPPGTCGDGELYVRTQSRRMYCVHDGVGDDGLHAHTQALPVYARADGEVPASAATLEARGPERHWPAQYDVDHGSSGGGVADPSDSHVVRFTTPQVLAGPPTGPPTGRRSEQTPHNKQRTSRSLRPHERARADARWKSLRSLMQARAGLDIAADAHNIIVNGDDDGDEPEGNGVCQGCRENPVGYTGMACLGLLGVGCMVLGITFGLMAESDGSSTHIGSTGAVERSLRFTSGGWEWADGAHGLTCGSYTRAAAHAGILGESAVFRIDPDGEEGLAQPFRVLCDADGFMLYAKVQPLTAAPRMDDGVALDPLYTSLPPNWFVAGHDSRGVAPHDTQPHPSLLSAHVSDSPLLAHAALGRARVGALQPSAAKLVVVPVDPAEDGFTTRVRYKHTGVEQSPGDNPVWGWFSSPGAADPHNQPGPTAVCDDAGMTRGCSPGGLLHATTGELAGTTVLGGMSLVAWDEVLLVPQATLVDGHILTPGVCIRQAASGVAPASYNCRYGVQVWLR